MSTLDTPAGYVQFDASGLRRYLTGLPPIVERLGGMPADWAIREVGDGNLNLVFLIDGPSGGVCVKQSLPHVRAVRAWRLAVERTFFEYTYFTTVGPLAGKLVPAIYHYEPELFCIVMEQLTPHVVLRRALVSGRTFPRVARDVAEFIALTTFATSDFGQPFEPKMDGIAVFAKNQALIRITTDLVFTDPYIANERNRNTPQLDDIAAEFRADPDLRVAAGRLGHRFLSNPQALIHGDLHSGSVMVTPTDSRIIDPEFALYGPIGFDLGAFIGNLLIAYFAAPGLAAGGPPRGDVQEWILDQLAVFWDHFRERFLQLWTDQPGGDAFRRAMFADEPARRALRVEQERFIAGVYDDAIGFAAVKMIRRILGFAHVIDFEEIADPRRRAACERATLELARRMLVDPQRFGSIGALIAAVRESSPPETTRTG